MDVATGTVLVFGYRVLGMAFMAGIGILTARVLTESERGIYATTVIVIYGISAVLGSAAAAAGYQVSNQKRAPEEVAANGFILTVGFSLAILAAGGAAWLIYGGENSWLIWVVALAAVPMTLKNPFEGVFLGRNQLIRHGLSGSGHTIMTFVVMAVVLLVLGHDSAAMALTIWVVCIYLMLVVVMALSGGWWKWLISHRPDTVLLKQFLTFGSITSLATFVGFFNYRIDQLLVAALDGAAGAGVYASAIAIAEGVWLFSSPVAVASFARIGSYSRSDAARLAARTVRHTLLVVTSASILVFILAPWLISGLYGSRYEGATGSLRVLCIGTAFWAPASLLSTYFSVQLGRPVIPLVLASISCALNTVLSILLIPQFGYVGAAWATTISYGLTILVTVTLFLRLSDAKFSDLWRIRRDDLDSYVRMARRVLSGEILREFLPRASRGPA